MAKQEFFCTFPPLFISFSLPFYYYFLIKRKEKKNPLLALSLKSLTRDANLSSLAPCHCYGLHACLISWLLIAGCGHVSIIKFGFKKVSEMETQPSRQRVLTLRLVIQVQARGLQPAFANVSDLARFKCAPLELFGKAEF